MFQASCFKPSSAGSGGSSLRDQNLPPTSFDKSLMESLNAHLPNNTGYRRVTSIGSTCAKGRVVKCSDAGSNVNAQRTKRSELRAEGAEI